MHFCHLRKALNDPILTLDGTPIPVVEENKFLGFVFDRKLSFIPHIKQLKAKCQKALNLLRVVAHTVWGADRKVLLNLYRTIIRSKLDYGSLICESARKSYLEMLDPIHHQGLSGVLGSIPGLATYFRFSFRFFKKGSCQLLAKVCARSTG